MDKNELFEISFLYSLLSDGHSQNDKMKSGKISFFVSSTQAHPLTNFDFFLHYLPSATRI